MIWFWRFITGFITITFCGEESATMLNVATKNNIKIWNLRCKKGCIIGNISIKNFHKLRYIKRGIKCRVKIIDKKGFVFRAKKYSNRTGFFAGVISFFAILFFLSNFVWIINIEGNKNIKNYEILNTCKKIGITEGMYKRKIDCKYDAQRLLLSQKGLAWCSLNLEGCVLTVNLTEAKVSDKQERQLPSNIKASFDGKISKIDAKSGNVVVKVGDTVSKGDLLVSGIIQNMSSTHFVYSDATIVAKTTRIYSAEGEFLQQFDKEINVKKRNSVEFFGIKIPLFLGSVKGEYKYHKKIQQLEMFDNKIPIRIANERYVITEKDILKYDSESLENMLYNDIVKQVEQSDLISATEIDRQVINTSRGILLNITYDCEENIAVQDKILLDTQN